MASSAFIRAQVEKELPGALTTYARPESVLAPTGISALDQDIGGVPISAVTQVCASSWRSSGKTTFLLSLMAQTTNRGEFCALVDASDCFDPVSAEAAGVDLARVLWVRCGERTAMRPLEQAFKATDILIQNGGFGLIAVDLGNHEERLVKKVPLTTWFRFARVVEKLPTALLFLASAACAQSCAGLTVHFVANHPQWHRQESVSHGRLLGGLEFEAEIARARLRKPVQSVKPRFTARSQWIG